MAVQTAPPARRQKMIWMIGDVLQLAGLILLLYVGGLYAQSAYNAYAARGDSDLPAPEAVVVAPVANAPIFALPRLNTVSSGQIVSAPPVLTTGNEAPAVSRVVIPAIAVDSKVVPVGWEIVEQQGQQVAVWQVAEYAVGQHQGSANPGSGGNIVLAGHVGGYGRVFRDLYNLKPGDQITLYSGGAQYLYVVTEHHVVQEEGVSEQQRRDNARFLEPTPSETVTLITCWPASGPDKFVYRVIIRAVPYGAPAELSAGLPAHTLR